MPSDLMTSTEVAEYLQVHRSTLYKLIRRRQIPVFKIGSDYRFYRDAIKKWIADREGLPPEIRQMPLHHQFKPLAFSNSDTQPEIKTALVVRVRPA